MSRTDKARRPGYAPANLTLGRRGLHTRDLIVARAGQLFVAKGYHGTSIDAIAKAVGGSRAAIYQYFPSKDDIFRELVHQCEPAVLDHARLLGRLGPDADGIATLRTWLAGWSALYDKYAMVFLEFPGIGAIEGLPQTDAGAVSDEYARVITAKLRSAGVEGIDAADAAAVLIRISHMVTLYRFRGMFGLDSSAGNTDSLTIALQLLLFPSTPTAVVASLDAANAGHSRPPGAPGSEMTAPQEPPAASPIRHDMMAAASALFNERGYYAVGMEDIAAAADVSRATLYRHFSTKLAIFDELSRRALAEGTALAGELNEQANSAMDFDALQSWLARYVRFHRDYSGVIRAWYDGTLAEQLPDETVSSSTWMFHAAAASLLGNVELPPGMDPAVGAAVFLAVLGRLAEWSMARRPATVDDTADLMLVVLRRSLLRGSGEPAFTPR